MARLALLLALALVAALVASLHVTASHASTSVPTANGFAGPVSSAPRAIDRDLETTSQGSLHRVACGTGNGLRCWVAGR
ncbi:MAG: hypothetical protein ABUS54_09495 [Actinomycetota bacterium]